MNIRAQVFQILSNSSFSVYGRKAPGGSSPPYAVFSIISNVAGYTHDGPDETGEARVQVSCYANTYGGAGAVVDSIVNAVHTSTNTYGVRKKRKVNEVDFYEEDTNLYHIPVDFILGHVKHTTGG